MGGAGWHLLSEEKGHSKSGQPDPDPTPNLDPGTVQVMHAEGEPLGARLKKALHAWGRVSGQLSMLG